MACETIHDTNGRVIAIFCGRSRKITCKFCHSAAVTKLCDFPVAKGKTCDVGMCRNCSTKIALEVDYCPNHKGQTPPQSNLFGE